MTNSYDPFARFYDLFGQEAPNDVPFYLDRSRTAGRILEVGCGTGRILIELAKALPNVSFVGVDSSEEMLKAAEHKKNELNIHNIELVHADVRDLNLDRMFDLILVTYQTFQFILTVEDQLQALQNVQKHLRPGGTCILHVFNPDAKQIANPGPKEVPRYSAYDPVTERNIYWISRSTIHPAEQLIDFTAVYRFDHPDNTDDEILSPAQMRYFYRFELEHLAARCQFQVQELLGGFDGTEYNSSSSDLIITLTKGDLA